jgi:hypothetical protein
MSRRSLIAFLSPPLVLAAVVSLPATGAPTDADMVEPFPHPKGYVCYRASAPVVIDGDLKDMAWDAAPWTDVFVDIEGDKKPKPRFRTRVKMLYDDDALYIAAEMEEPHLWATLKTHDSVIFYDNDFEVFLEPDGDNHMYGELELNALNTTWDLLLTKPYKDSGHAINAWEITGLKTAVRLDGTLNDPRDTDKGWTLEIKWPWSGLKELANPKAAPMPPKDGDRWRINFSRVEWDTEVVEGKYKKTSKIEHNWVWSPQGVIDMHRPERWGYLQFSTAKPGTAPFKPDADWEIRDALHRAYYAQRAHHAKHGKFAGAAGDLGLKLPAGRVAAEATRNSYEMTWQEPGKPRYAITHDGRIRKE